MQIHNLSENNNRNITSSREHSSSNEKGNNQSTGNTSNSSSDGNGKKSIGGNSTNSGNSGSKDSFSGGNVCREGTDFVVTYNPVLPYPISMQRIGKKGTVVVQVKFNFNSNGSISVISLSGGESVFQSEARKAASKIKVSIKNSETLKCTITKSFKFTLN